MSQRKYDLAVAYRVYPRVSKTPAVHADNKFRLAELCLRSFQQSLDSVRARIFVLLDACPPEYRDLVARVFDAADLEIIPLDGIGNLPSFVRQIDILLEQDHAEAVYFAEDDYFYFPGQFRLMLDFQRHADADFVSPYDHPDYYGLPIHGAGQQIRCFGGRHWRTAASTCLTFLTTRRVLARTQRVFRTYARRNLDVSLWMSLTKQTVFHPGRIWQCARRRMAMAGYVAAAWYYCWPQILFGRRYRLWVPMPTIATHMESTGLAPGVDWQQEFARFQSNDRPAGRVDATARAS